MPSEDAAAVAPERDGPLPIALLGIPFDPLTISEAISRIGTMIASRRPHFLVTANVDFLIQAGRDAELRQAFYLADYVLCDGTPLVWASRWLGNRLPGRSAGSDLVPALVETAAERGWKLFFLGAAEGVAAEAARRMNERYPTLPPIAHYAPPFKPLREMDHADIARRIQAAQPDVLLVAFGCPKQEKWIVQNYRTLGVPVSIGVGATLDFLAGRVRRAPRWMRVCGLEWAFRLLQEPRRLYQRYADDLVHFFPGLLRQWRLLGRSAPEPTAAPPGAWAERTHYGLRITVSGHFHRAALRQAFRFWMRAAEAQGHCLVDLSRVSWIDSTGIAFLACWQKRLAASRRNLILQRPSPAVREALARLGVTDQFVITETP